jgi:predicted ATP-grasp superfamily ATP-dependent carboligase
VQENRRFAQVPCVRPTVSTPILLTEDAPSYGVLAAARALRAAGFRPSVAVTADGGYSTRSSAVAEIVSVPDPRVDGNGFVAALADAAQRLGATAILPGTEPALSLLAAHPSSFPAGVALGTCPPEIVRRATDKSLLPELAAAAGVEVPPTSIVDRGELAATLRRVELPAVIKPLDRVASGDGPTWARRVTAVGDIDHVVEPLGDGNWLVQPFVRGVLYAIGGVAWDGEIVCSVHQVAHRISPPDCGGTSYGQTVPRDPALEALGRRLVREVEWSGLFQLQFIRTAGHDYLIDLNPRIYGTLALAVGAGMNLPAVWAQLLLGEEPSFDGYRDGVHFRSEEKDGLALLAAIRRGEWVGARAFLRPRRRTVHAAFAARDPLPVLTSLNKVTRARRVLRSFDGTAAKL